MGSPRGLALALLHRCCVTGVVKPILVYDRDCAFCRRWVARWHARTGDAIEYRPLQQRGLLRRLGIPLSSALRAAQLVTTNGERYEGADAVLRALSLSPRVRLAAHLARLPIVRTIAQRVYQQVARHRGLAARVDNMLFGRSLSPPDTARVREMFMRGLGGVYLIAFTSLRRQVLGLYGERGILPIREYMEMARMASLAQEDGSNARRMRSPSRRAIERARLVPSVFWLDASDASLIRACTAGQVCAGLSMLGIAPRLTAAASWALYLSFASAGREFLSFQWDALLLENGLYATIVATAGNRAKRTAETPPWPATLLMRWLAFRIQFESGHCKLASGDRTWRTCTACCYHYRTQPLPTPLGWYAHQLPRWFQRASTFAALAIELGGSFLVFAPRRLRRAGFWLLSGLQALIAATGNYGFFNLLTIVDNLWILDDEAIPLAPRHRLPPRRAPIFRRLGVAFAALPLVALSASILLARVSRRVRIPRTLARLHDAIAPLRSVNPYGLFAVMTTKRPEIVIEGSDDGRTWAEYEFRYKPGDPRRAPRRVAPHQPRLDWQMWFAALEPPPPWFARLLLRLLEGSPEVLALLERNPFADHAPKYMRALLYEYRMTDRETRRRTGMYWERELLGFYIPPCTRAPVPSRAPAEPPQPAQGSPA